MGKTEKHIEGKLWVELCEDVSQTPSQPSVTEEAMFQRWARAKRAQKLCTGSASSSTRRFMAPGRRGGYGLIPNARSARTKTSMIIAREENVDW